MWHLTMGSMPGLTKCEHQTDSRPSSARICYTYMCSFLANIPARSNSQQEQMSGPAMQATLDATLPSAHLDTRGAFWVLSNVFLSSQLLQSPLLLVVLVWFLCWQVQAYSGFDTWCDSGTPQGAQAGGPAVRLPVTVCWQGTRISCRRWEGYTAGVCQQLHISCQQLPLEQVDCAQRCLSI